RIRLDDFSLPTSSRPLVVEGAGGLLVPLNDQDYMIDLIRQLGLPVILVARTTLGTINHTLLSLEALVRRNIPVRGIILSGPENRANHATIATITKVAILASIPHLDPLTPATLARVAPLAHDLG
ncbi:MAG TPA: dethiobiotin synthase, partial [Magnetococcales bacterium]|nr:dethiobiotin synthase [Magnetococcales bacterium]